ncbi:hypothetical protein L195_g059449 [Trifolium pratense]|uniref:Uncharacterized protein n=1 Tax=Trifolium pratense TaxID=57577 RepID=A0A2K3JY72_TRIPR|nr:hypothetical protein L195_g059449 [Trifolium pratense]
MAAASTGWWGDLEAVDGTSREMELADLVFTFSFLSATSSPPTLSTTTAIELLLQHSSNTAAVGEFLQSNEHQSNGGQQYRQQNST